MDTIQGTVARVNGHGFTLQGREGWLNVSRYASPEAAPMPTVGAQVVLALDSKGFVRKIVPADGATPSPNGHDAPDSQGTRRGGSGRDATITRLAVLNTATAILASGSQVADPDAVLELAERLERWALR